MDLTSLQTAGVSTSAIALLFCVYKVFECAIGHRLISDCCGKRMSVGVDVRDMPHSPDSSENQTLKTPLVPKAKSSESLSVYPPREKLHRKVKGIIQYFQRRRGQTVEEEDFSPVSSDLASSGSKESAPLTSSPNSVESSSPPTLVV